MEELLKHELKSSKMTCLGNIGGGCISEAQSYETDEGNIFVKINRKSEAKNIFDGEYASLVAFLKIDFVKVPKPIKVFDLPDKKGAVFVMEYLDMSSGLSKFASKFGHQLASLHLHNWKIKEELESKQGFVHKDNKREYIDKFGFDVPTCCGYLKQSNNWEVDWMRFYSNKIEEQIAMLELEKGDREARELWNTLLPNLHKLFDDITIQPALLHGDLWGGNVAETKDGPVIFDPASFYGHSEYDLAISHMFGGFNREFFTAYHQHIPKAEGYSQRLELYKLFHYINHWNHFGSGYRSSSISTLKSLNTLTK